MTEERAWVPRLHVTVRGPCGHVELEVIIDTGFDGDLALPNELAERLGLRPIGLISIELGNGISRPFPVSLAETRIRNLRIWAEVVILSAGEPLIGLGLLSLFNKLIIDFRQQTVELQ